MDASDLIKKLKEKTIFYNLQVQFSTAQAGCVPTVCGASNGCSYQFSDYETRLDYFNGRAEVVSTCSTLCFQ